MSLRRGFKANANRISLRLRRSLGLSFQAPIDITIVARRMQVILVPLSSFAGEYPREVEQLAQIDRGAFSAATLQVGRTKRIIVYNDCHSARRRSSSIAHEIAHMLLGHQFTLPIDPSGSRNLDRDLEDEANWLGSAILISDEAAVFIVRSAMDTETACKQYGVSEAMLQMRINASGARIRVRRSYH